MRSLLTTGVILFFLGCSEDPLTPVQEFAPADIELGGVWTIAFDTGVEWRLSIQHDSVYITGFVQPDTSMPLYMEIEGETEKGKGDFRFEGRSWTFFHVFQCRMRGTTVFEGGMELFDILTDEPIREFSFTATKNPGTGGEPPYPPPTIRTFLSEEPTGRPDPFIPSRADHQGQAIDSNRILR
jgi:hypothetical protein